MSHPYDLDAKPTAQEAVKRLSSGFSLSENANHAMSPKDDKFLKLTTFSLQNFLKVKSTEFINVDVCPLTLVYRTKSLLPSF
jgi:hypothetical protein